MAILGCIWATFTQLKGEVVFIGEGAFIGINTVFPDKLFD